MSEQKKSKRAERAIARHGDVHATSRFSTLFGILGRALVVVLVSTLTVTGISAYQLSQEMSRNALHVTSLNGEKRVIPPLDGPLNLLLVGSDTRQGAGNAAFGDITSNLADDSWY